MADTDKQQGARSGRGPDGPAQGARGADDGEHGQIPVPTPPQGRQGTGAGRKEHTGAVTGSGDKD
ncbi:hypothetical protein [Zavarzinia sp. CC-PAN008]|uniref:hypothetical protein n=1 Tax=Zavarzinia sp. CC-PAN008 TaxID=3243332 RepID=UPI003F7438AF